MVWKVVVVYLLLMCGVGCATTTENGKIRRLTPAELALKQQYEQLAFDKAICGTVLHWKEARKCYDEKVAPREKLIEESRLLIVKTKTSS